jgi:hypothetical protein
MKRTLTGFLAAFYFLSNVVLSHAVESNIWNERRQASGARQVAALPSAIAPASGNPAELLRQFPDVARRLDRVASVSRVNGRVPAAQAVFLESVSLNNGTLREVYVHPSLERVAPMLLIIQDVHLNREAQKNISQILTSLNDRAAKTAGARLFLGVEGAAGAFDLKGFRAFSDLSLRKAVADYFLAKNRISAASHAALVAEPLAADMVGIDDAGHYAANVEAYRSSQAAKKDMADKAKAAADRFKAKNRMHKAEDIFRRHKENKVLAIGKADGECEIFLIGKKCIRFDGS